MKKKVAINGFGRIGRLVFRQIFFDANIEVVAINDLTTPKELAYLLEHDSAQGKFMPGEISSTENSIIIAKKEIKILKERNPEDLPWGKLQVDLVVESTGLFLTPSKAYFHINAGAKKVLLSAPSKKDSPHAQPVKTIVFGVNHKTLVADDKIASGASCTTNCLALPVDYIHEKFTIKKGWMTTIHSATNDQRVLDLPHSDPRRGRSALANIIPTSTGAAIAVGLVIPALNGKLDGVAFRVPTITGSVVDLTVELAKKVTVKDINDLLIEKAKNSKCFDATYNPIVSTDIIGETHGSIADLSMTKIVEADNKQLVKVISWYDNENSYVSQYVRTLKYWINL